MSLPATPLRSNYLSRSKFGFAPTSVTNVMKMFQQVRQLLDLITKSVDTLEQACIESNTQPPSLDEPFQSAYEAFWANSLVAETTSIISAAALHLNAAVSPPRNILLYAVGGVCPIDLISS